MPTSGMSGRELLDRGEDEDLTTRVRTEGIRLAERRQARPQLVQDLSKGAALYESTSTAGSSLLPWVRARASRASWAIPRWDAVSGPALRRVVIPVILLW